MNRKYLPSDGWVGVDFDGTLAQHPTRWSPYACGEPIPSMVDRVRRWLASGFEVRIMTARATVPPDPLVTAVLEAWCVQHLGRKLRITCQKDYGMLELWDDRAMSVEPGTGRHLGGVSRIHQETLPPAVGRGACAPSRVRRYGGKRAPRCDGGLGCMPCWNKYWDVKGRI